MPAPSVWTEITDRAVFDQFDEWGRKKANLAGDYVIFIKEVDDRFKADPVMATALSMQAQFTGIPSRGDESVTGLGKTLPRDILDEVDRKVHQNQERNEDGTLADYDEKDEDGVKFRGGLAALGAVPVPTDAFDGAVAWARQKVESLWEQYLAERAVEFEREALDYDPRRTYDPRDANDKALKDTEDKDQVRYVQKGNYLLIGENHDAEALQWTRANATSLGNIEVTKGAFLSAGELRVWGCVKADRDDFKKQIARFSNKKVNFR